jgi:two-component system, chemotaxis family, chemotaxis protein CheY
MRILIVDDNATNRKILEKHLEGFGDMDFATTGIEAIRHFSAAHAEGKPFSLVLLDIMMPDLDGQRALEELRRIEQEKGVEPEHGAKIVMCTALGDYDNILNAIQNMCDGYITKPIKKLDLIVTLQNLGVIPAEQAST